jgi:hypothetical protein
MNKDKNKIKLRRETLRDLTAQKAGEIKGGKGATTKKKCATVYVCDTMYACW